MKREDHTSHRARDHPASYYFIVDNGDGTVDVYLCLSVKSYPTNFGVVEHDAKIGVVKGVEWWDGLEDDIRARFDAWCDSCEVIVM